MWIPAALVAGAGLGGFFFCGLWLTVSKLPHARHATLLLFASLLLRAGVVLPGFFVVMGGRWERMVAAIAGFLIARMWLIRRFGDVEQPAATSN
jgi:F1F0 ATPase subunit 2